MSNKLKNQLVEGYTQDHLFAAAEAIVLRKTANSKLLKKAAEDVIPKFYDSEIFLGRVLGTGGFCVVKEVTSIKFNANDNLPHNILSNLGNTDHNEHSSLHFIQDRSFIASNVLRGKNKDCRYAIKKTKDSCRSDASTFVNSIVDLAVEARFLSVLRHANIIKMRGMCIGTPYNNQFFLLLDRLYDTLTTRLVKWKKQKPVGMRKILDWSGKKEIAFWFERCTFAYDLACALKFLHRQNVMYRDIKPDNIGFDVRGDIKLFDFGLAREFDPTKRDANGLFKFTSDTGSPRYMDPLIALGKPYNELCDVYSFCILLWQMLELDSPFEGFTLSVFTKRVVNGGARPLLDPKWPEELKQLMRNGWGTISNRPSMCNVCETLRQELCRHSDHEILEFMDVSHKRDDSLREAEMPNINACLDNSIAA